MDPDLIWEYKGLKVYYRPELDGAGSRLASAFLDFLHRQNLPPGGRALEWCAGPGFLGFALLAEGLCGHLCLIDINPAAIACAQRTIRENGLEGRVSVYRGDNLAALPASERFDVVISNPPNFYGLNPRHSRYELYKDDLRPNDPQWRIHRGFYVNIRPFLRPGAKLYISEVEPEKAEVYIPRAESEPYDIRPRPALDDFIPMIEDGGLRYEGTELFFRGADGAELSIMTSGAPADAVRA